MESHWRSSRVAEAVTRAQPLRGLDEWWRPSADALFFLCSDEAAFTNAKASVAHFRSDQAAFFNAEAIAAGHK